MATGRTAHGEPEQEAEGITASAGDFHAGGLIRYSRGEIVVLDRPGLERAACSCYNVDRRSYSAVLN